MLQSSGGLAVGSRLRLALMFRVTVRWLLGMVRFVADRLTTGGAM